MYFGVEKGIVHDLLADYDGVVGKYYLVIELYIVTSRGLSFAVMEDILFCEVGFEFFVHLVYRVSLDLELILSLSFFNLYILLTSLDWLL